MKLQGMCTDCKSFGTFEVGDAATGAIDPQETDCPFLECTGRVIWEWD